jgi:hypothetical protein
VRATCVKIAAFFGVMLLGLGCRHTPPNLKPPDTKEALNAPPNERRYDVPNYPKEAFLDRDAIKKIDDGPIQPVRGPGMPGGMGGGFH